MDVYSLLPESSPLARTISYFQDDPNSKALSLRNELLGDYQCQLLFQWLAGKDATGDPSGDAQRKRPRSLERIDMANASISERGVKSIIEYLEALKSDEELPSATSPQPNISLKTLNLAGNKIRGNAETARSLVSALSPGPGVSGLAFLSLSNNPITPEFRKGFITSLHLLPSLRVLFLSLTSLTLSDAYLLAAYVADKRCKLVELHANANNMKYGGVKAVVRAVEVCRSLEKVELATNTPFDNDDETIHDISDAEDLEIFTTTSATPTLPNEIAEAVRKLSKFRKLNEKLQVILQRNSRMKRLVHVEAADLLKYSTLVLRNRKEMLLMNTSSAHEPEGDARSTSSNPQSSLLSLPLELQFSILSHLAPTLSPAQRIRIFNSIVNREPMPRFLLCFLGRPQVPWTKAVHEDRRRWLERIGCDVYDPPGS